MSYVALYRKFRPSTFEDVKGQNHIVTTLKNQIKAERIGHAYLFCGTRGTGKTTIAKILAKAVNCEHPIDGSPCNVCETCQTIQSGASMNVIEIDAASNNGVDNIREIREEVAYRPTQGRYKVYIIDEVHMLSVGAFNALLKTLEEPPSYVIFILATTEAHKIPVTILSRCQRYDFKRITVETIANRLQELMDKEKVEVEHKAIRYIAKAADGSMRDSLSLLDQCIAFYLGQTLTYDKVLEVLGAVDTEVFSELLRNVVTNRVADTISLLERMITKGKELGQFINDFTWYLRNLLLAKTSDNIEEVIDVSTDTLNRIKEERNMVDNDTLMRYIRVLSEVSNQLRYATQKRVLVEITLIKLCQPAMDKEQDISTLKLRLQQLEDKIEKGLVVTKEQVPMQVVKEQVAAAPEVPLVKPEKAAPQDLQKIKQDWKRIISEVPNPLKQFLQTAMLKYDGKTGENKLFIIFSNTLAERHYNDPDVREQVTQIISQYVGKLVEVELRLEGEDNTRQTLADISIDEIFHNNIQMDVVIEEDN